LGKNGDRHFTKSLTQKVPLFEGPNNSIIFGPHDVKDQFNYFLRMTSSTPLSRQISNDTITPPASELKLLTIRTHTAAFSSNEVLIDPSLVPFAKPGSLLQIIPQSDIENESAAASDRYIFRLGEETEKDVTTKYGNLQLSVVTEVGKAFRFLPGNNVAVSLVLHSLRL
jgi:hypothetical protein